MFLGNTHCGAFMAKSCLALALAAVRALLRASFGSNTPVKSSIWLTNNLRFFCSSRCRLPYLRGKKFDVKSELDFQFHFVPFLPAEFDNDIELPLLDACGASPHQVDDIQVFADVLHDLDLFHQVKELILVHGGLDHFDGHRRLDLVLNYPHSRRLDNSTKSPGTNLGSKFQPSNIISLH